MTYRLLAASLLILIFGTGCALAQAAGARPKAQTAPKPAATVGTVGIVAGDLDSTEAKVASDLARLLDDGNTLRIIPIIGKGSFQNINDLLTMKAVDLAIIQSDVMARYLKMNRATGLQARMSYISKLYSKEVHILSRMQFTCLADLSGRRVSFGPKDSGMAITAEAVFDAHNVSVDPLYLDHEEAIDRLKRGELDAMVHVDGKPTRAFDRITHKDRVHFLDLDYLPALQSLYLPAVMTAEDYPNLIAKNENVATIGVSSVMAVHNWNPQSERFRVMTRFVERFFSEFEKLKTGSYSPKWREVNLRAAIRGWQRFQPAEKWLIANAQTRPGSSPSQVTPQAEQLKAMVQKFVDSQRTGSADQDDLFNQFVRWYQQQQQNAQQQ